MRLNYLVQFLDRELRIRKIKDESRNGLQVRAGDSVNKIAFAVDACLEVFQKAKTHGCDLLIVHHGLLWKGQKFKELTKRRISFLKKNHISLYGAHLPLDAHNIHGNNIQLCKLLGVSNTKGFGKYHGASIGFRGTIQRQSIASFARKVEKKLQTKCRILSFGPQQVEKIGIVSGGGSAALEEAIMKKLDCFLTGEAPHSAYHNAKESKINLVMAGHYKTETLGVKALSQLINQKFNIETVFIDAPTGM